MAGFKFFHIPKPKGFNYKPMYYDESKEAMREREERIRKELGLNSKDTPFVPTIKGQFHKARKRPSGSSRQSNIRVLIILFILLLIVYFLFFR
ncbi:MAG: hypothetical protein PWR03_995 [Tenuifilum sp.]|jgi:hypothetical protein|uniref:hypothetical protein n=1 Tax=Tenuifilum sp. TaxID=2760880 RepID=UPI0024AB8825|nr:hypothetical protein [Tenuifilum sp.]MDI3526812.1 hypothetical protein [Tenuifilum sp.]